MKHNLTIYQKLCRIITVTLIYLLAFFVIYTICLHNLPSILWLTGIPVTLTAYAFIERYMFHALPFFALHWIFFIPVLLTPFPNHVYTFLYMVFLVMENIRAFYLWKHEITYKELPWYLFFLIAVIYIASVLFHQNRLADCVYYIGLGLLFMHFVRYFLNGLANLFAMEERTTTMPTKKIVITNTLLLTFIPLLFTTLCLLAHHYHFDSFLYTVVDVLSRLGRAIIRLLLYIIAFLRFIVSSDEEQSEVTRREQDFQNAVSELSASSDFGKIFNVLIYAIFTILAFYLLFHFVQYLIRFFLKRHGAEQDIVVKIVEKPERTKKKKTPLSIVQKWSHIFDTSYSAKIRRIYRFRIKNYEDLEINPGDTPTGLANRIAREYDDDIEGLTLIYEKARYSTEEITIEDFQEI